MSKINLFIKEQVKTSRNELYLAIGLGGLSGLLVIFQAWLMATMISDVIFKEAQLAELQNRLWYLIIIFIIRAILNWTSNLSAFKAVIKIKLDLRDKIHRHIQKIGPVHATKKHSGSDVNTMIDGVEAIEKYYTSYIPGIAFVSILPLAYIIVTFPFDWISGLVLLVTAPIIVFFMIMIGQGAEKLNQEQWRQLSRLSSHFIDTIQGLPTLKIFNAAKREAAIIAKLADEYRERTMSVLKVAFLSSLLLEFFSSIGVAIVAVLIGFRLLDGNMEFVDGLFVLLLAPEYYLSIRNMGGNYHAKMEGIGAAEQIIEILDRGDFTKNTDTNLLKSDLNLTNNKSISIAFNNLSFSYEKDRQALTNFNLKIPANKRTVLIGESGSGKSTIVNLILGFIQTNEGEILVNNKDISKISLETWRKNIAWLPQQAHLFQGTIADNIRLGKENATEHEVKEAARLAFCDEFIEKLPETYNTIIGERGAGLSGGQIQRIALARTFLKDAPLLILDEASANLDRESEKLIEKSIDMLSENRTVIIIAHKLHTIEKADQIVLIKNGTVLNTGTHKQLINNNEHYQELIKKYHETFTI
ncbi:MAG TPA: thiol reductant ABC exporter subunit CydD [Flavobacteriaceae bacterium]|jgi:ATP-binding cassette subfamily C protein CydD|nr:thiol reductant ABC exporter subunit CydD [Flavobacteriaceae bacterium]